MPTTCNPIFNDCAPEQYCESGTKQCKARKMGSCSDDTCPEGFECDGGACVSRCRNDDECDAGWKCVSQVNGFHFCKKGAGGDGPKGKAPVSVTSPGKTPSASGDTRSHSFFSGNSLNTGLVIGGVVTLLLLIIILATKRR